MEDFENMEFWIKWTLPAEERIALSLNAEIEQNGYALTAFRLPRSQRVIGTTLGLSWMGHPEIASTAGTVEEVLAFLRHLAEQVTVHQQSFDIGRGETPFFKELNFRELDLDLNFLGFFDEALQGLDPEWILCEAPVNDGSINAYEQDQDFRSAA